MKAPRARAGRAKTESSIMRILVAVAYVGLIFTLSTWSHPPSGPDVAHLDKLVHTVEYGILGLLIGWAAAGRTRGWRGLALLLAIGLLVALTDEMIQRRTPGRDSSLHDALADGVGLCLAWAVSGGRWLRMLVSRAPEGHE